MSIGYGIVQVEHKLSGLLEMTHTLQEQKSLILADPLDDSLRVELEQLFSTTEPNDVEHELLRRERQIAEDLDLGRLIDEQINEYIQFMIAQSGYFWDRRGNVNYLFRPFSLWLVYCEPSREYALDIALRNKNIQEIDFQSLPIEIDRGNSPDCAYQLKNGIIDFVRRYRGPSGNEPDLMECEIEIVMLATYSQVTPQQNTNKQGDEHKATEPGGYA